MNELKGSCKYFIFFQLFITFTLGKNNILLIIADDFRPSIGCYGDLNAYTPNIDLFSQESVLFLKAYAQQALCAPSRNSFLTSRRPDTLHLYDFYSYWREFVGNFTTLPQYFKEHGYFTKSIGKVFHPGISSNFSDDQPFSWSVPAYHPPTEAYKEAAVCRGNRRNLVCPVVPRLQPGGTLPDLQSLHEARSYLRGASADQPFLLAVGFHKPHVPLKYPLEYLKHHPLDNVSLPAGTWPVGLPPVAWNPWTDVRAREDISALNISFPFGRMPDEWSRLIRQSYYAAVTYIDDLIGQLMQELKSTGLYENTIIALIGDHGWSLGEHGEWSKFSNFETAVRVPMMVRVPGLTGGGQRVIPAPVELLDLFPTLAAAAGLPSLPPCPACSDRVALCTQGTNLMPAIYAAIVKNETVRDIGKPAVSQYPRPGVYPTSKPNSDKPRLAQIRYMGYSLRTAQYRYTEWPRWQWRGGEGEGLPDWDRLAGAELYDHSLDTGENINLANHPMMRKTRAELSHQLRSTVSHHGF